MRVYEEDAERHALQNPSTLTPKRGGMPKKLVAIMEHDFKQETFQGYLTHEKQHFP